MNKQLMMNLWQHRSVKIGIGLTVITVVAVALKPGKDDSRIDMENAHLCRVQRGDLVVSILQSGELKAKTSRDILNEAYRDAKITSLVDDGATVTNGQLLFELESSQLSERYLDQQSDVAEAEAGLKLAQENLEIARLKNATDQETARLKVELARLDLQKYEEVEYAQMVEKAESEIMLAEEELKKARSELEGTQELFDKGYSNKNDLDSDRLGVQRKEVEVRNKTADLEILQKYTHVKKQKELENALTNAVASLERLKKTINADIESKEASIESKKTRLEIEKNQLITREEQFANTKAYADFTGQVFYSKPRRYGSLAKIEEGATVQFRQPILSFPDLSAWDLKVGIPEAMIDKVTIGQEAVATLDAVPGLVLKGRVEKISAVPDSQNWYSSGVKTYTIMVDVNTNGDGQLKPGMSATVEIVTDQLRDVIYVPIQSVVSSGDKHYVYVVKRGRKKLREVEIGKYNNQSIEIVHGVEEDEELLLYAEVELEAETKLKKSPLSEESKNGNAKVKE
jgi:HlyD family secretion protein